MKKATDTQISQWKKQYGDKLVLISVPVHKEYTDEELEKIAKSKEKKFDPEVEREVKGYFRKPGIQDIMAVEEAHPDNAVKQNLKLFELCHLGGDPEMVEDEFKFAASNIVTTLFKIRRAVLKKV